MAETPIRIFVKRPTPLTDLNVVYIRNFNTEFGVELWQQVGDEPPTRLVDQKFTPSTTTPPPPPPTSGSVLWKSAGLWDNGKARTLTNHHEYDPDDPLSEVAAGGHGTPRKWFIPGDANHSFLGGGMSRVYTHTPHEGKVEWYTILVWNKSLEPGDGNLSIELYSCHNEGGDVDGKPIGWMRFGGVTVSFHKSSVESKIEYYHAVYSKGQSEDLPTALEDGKSYPIKIVGTRRVSGDNGEYTLEPFIDYGQGMQSLGTFVHRTNVKQAPGFIRPPLYWRWRVNGSGPKDVEVKDMVFTQL